MTPKRRILVLLKQVASTIRFTRDHLIDRASAVPGFNPDDGAALEAALLLKDAGNAHITVLTLGPESAAAVLRDALACGADEAILVTDPAFRGSDSLCTARTLAAAIRKLGAFDLILCGRRASDGDTGQVPPMLAGFMNAEFLPDLTEIPTGFRGVATVARAKSYLRRPTIMGLRKASRAVIAALDRTALELPPELCGLTGSPTRVLHTEAVEQPVKTPCILDGRSALDFIRTAQSESPAPTPANTETDDSHGRCIVLEHPIDPAYTRGYAVQVMPLPDGSIAESAKSLADILRSSAPDLVLAASDTRARSVLPYTAALLGLGMTADCTEFAHRNGGLVQIRPAFGGDLMAHIVSGTAPALATVRASVTSRVMLAGGCGLGSKANFKRLSRIAAVLGTEIGASRGAVDAGFAPYSMQIGQSGKSAAVNLYVAVGISGAAQHMAGLKNVPQILAVNTDRLAPILLHADAAVQADCEQILTLWEQELHIV